METLNFSLSVVSVPGIVVPAPATCCSSAAAAVESEQLISRGGLQQALSAPAHCWDQICLDTLQTEAQAQRGGTLPKCHFLVSSASVGQWAALLQI